jgi:hypothetical protein
MVSETFESPFCTPIDSVCVKLDDSAPLLALDFALSSMPFAEKYSDRSWGVVPAMAILKLEPVDKFLVKDRNDLFCVCRRHDLHTVVRPLGLKALAAGYRIIIACHWKLTRPSGSGVEASESVSFGTCRA